MNTINSPLSKKIDSITHNTIFSIKFTLDSLKSEFIGIILYYITITFYFFVFGPTIQNLRTNTISRKNEYMIFFTPGLIILTIIGSISSQSLIFWHNASNNKLMPYWLSLPVSIRFLLAFFSFNAIINSIFYTFPLIVALIYFKYNLMAIFVIILLIILGSNFLYLLQLGFVLYLFNNNYFYVIQQTSQPLLTRLSPVFYNIIYIPVIFIPLTYLNPFTWLVMGMRNIQLGLILVVIFLILDYFIFNFVLLYWKKKIKQGNIIK